MSRLEWFIGVPIPDVLEKVIFGGLVLFVVVFLLLVFFAELRTWLSENRRR